MRLHRSGAVVNPSLGGVSGLVPKQSMYGIFTYIYHKKSTKCRYIYQSHGCYGVVQYALIPQSLHSKRTGFGAFCAFKHPVFVYRFYCKIIPGQEVLQSENQFSISSLSSCFRRELTIIHDIFRKARCLKGSIWSNYSGSLTGLTSPKRKCSARKITGYFREIHGCEIL